MSGVDQWVREGLAALQGRRLAEAESSFRRCLVAMPGQPQVLHWLGLTLLQRFQYAEAIAAIAEAGPRLGWPIEVRYNYSVAIGTSVPFYMPAAFVERMNQLADYREQTQRERAAKVPRLRVLLLHAGARPPSLIDSDANADEDGQRLEVLRERFTWGTADDDAGSVANRLSCDQIDYVCIADARENIDLAALRTVCRALHLNDAGWGFARVELAESAVVSAGVPAEVTTAVIRHATLAVCDSTTRECFANPLLPVHLSNIVIDRQTFAGLRWSGVSAHNALPRVVAALASQSEPLFVAEAKTVVDATDVALLQRNIQAIREANGQALEAIFLGFLNGEALRNPLAPDPRLHPVIGIRHFLRYGTGAYLTPGTLQAVAKRVAESNAAASAKPVRDGGVDVIGFTRAETGLGENLRSVVRVAQQAEIGVSAVELEFELGVRRKDRSVDEALVDAPSRAVRIYAVNPDLLGEVITPIRRNGMFDHYRVGCWAWELERLPSSWVAATEWMDEIWGISDFVRDSIARATNKPVFTLSSSITPPAPNRLYDRAEFGIPRDAIVFLYSFAYESYVARKNPWATIRAFRKAFPANVNDVCLVIKTSASARFAEKARSLRAEAGDDPRIVFIDAILTRDQVAGLQHCCDVYVSLHRSEGFGFGMAECMSIGKVVIATGYSANLDFMKPDNSLLVDYDLVPVAAGEYVDTDGQVWAEARVDDAADKMRFAYANHAAREEMGKRAASYIRTHFSPQAVAAVFRGHIQRIYRGL